MRMRERSFGAAIALSVLFGTLCCTCLSPAFAAISREGTAVLDTKLSSNDVQRGRMSWFGQYGYGPYSDGLHRHVWRDTGDNGRNASGLPQTVPGIALMDRRTLGHWFEVELNGRVFLVRQVDVGPHPRTGRRIDINAPLSDMAGWSPRNFPTDAIAKWRYVGPPATMLAMRNKPKLKELALIDTWDMGMTEQPKLAFDLVSPTLPKELPRYTRTASLQAPWMAAAPRTADLLTSPRHWSSLDKNARMNLGGPLVPLPPVPTTETVAAPPPKARPAKARQASRENFTVSRPRRHEETVGEQLMKPILSLFGLRW